MPREKYVAGEGFAKIQLYDENGKEFSRREGRNAVVQNGMAMLAKRIWTSPDKTAAVSAPRRVLYMELGRNGAAAASNQTDVLTALGTPDPRVAATVTQQAATRGRTVQWVHTWTANEFSATGIEEVVLYNSPTTTKGTCFARFVFTTVNKTKTEELRSLMV